jgi:hypothetical protein
MTEYNSLKISKMWMNALSTPICESSLIVTELYENTRFELYNYVGIGYEVKHFRYHYIFNFS